MPVLKDEFQYEGTAQAGGQAWL